MQLFSLRCVKSFRPITLLFLQRVFQNYSHCIKLRGYLYELTIQTMEPMRDFFRRYIYGHGKGNKKEILEYHAKRFQRVLINSNVNKCSEPQQKFLRQHTIIDIMLLNQACTQHLYNLLTTLSKVPNSNTTWVCYNIMIDYKLNLAINLIKIIYTLTLEHYYLLKSPTT